MEPMKIEKCSFECNSMTFYWIYTGKHSSVFVHFTDEKGTESSRIDGPPCIRASGWSKMDLRVGPTGRMGTPPAHYLPVIDNEVFRVMCYVLRTDLF